MLRIPGEIFSLIASLPSHLFGEQTGKWGDQGDGTFRNPVIAADFSNPDSLRVGDDYYLACSTFESVPGVTILHSRDLVNWSIIGGVVTGLVKIAPAFTTGRMDCYNQGVYAPSLRHHDGKFWVFVNLFTDGFFVATAKHSAGPWDVRQIKDRNGRPLSTRYWTGPCPLWDVDGKAYLASRHPGSKWFGYLFQMTPDGGQLLGADVDQRHIRSDSLTVEAKLDLAGMAPGQRAGRANFNGGITCSLIAVVVGEDGARKPVSENNDNATDGPALPARQTEIFLRSRCTLRRPDLPMQLRRPRLPRSRRRLPPHLRELSRQHDRPLHLQQRKGGGRPRGSRFVPLRGPQQTARASPMKTEEPMKPHRPTQLSVWLTVGMLALLPSITPRLHAAEAFDATRVRLLPSSPFHDRQELHRRGYLASFDPDKLLFHYRALAGLPQPEGVSGGYDGWDSGFIRGHMAGHYLSAASRMAAATGDETFRRRVNYVVDELGKCQDALKLDGYLAAFPPGAFDHLEGKPADNQGVVVPYYTVHKIMAGLLDAHDYVGNARALQIAERMADYSERRLAALDSEQLEKIFRTDAGRNPQNEFGAMSDALAELYHVTGQRKHLETARLFNRPWFVGPLAKGKDRLAGLHANTHVAQVVGIAHCANLGGDATAAAAAENFWRIVTREHSFVNGGNSFNEWFDRPGVETGPSIDDQRALPPTTAESCNTHNMLRLTARLFERKPAAEYADYYERALYNHLLPTIAADTGRVTYFTPLRGHFRTYLDGTFCCVGSGIENTPRYNEGIYFHQDDSLWVNLYIPSELDWREAGLVLRQEGGLTRGEAVRFTVVKAAGHARALNFRVPHWISGPATLEVNGELAARAEKPSTYLSLKREWKEGDVVTVTLPAALRLEHAKDNPAMVSVFFGPVLLAGELGRENMSDDFADKEAHLKLPAVDVPDIVAASADPAAWLRPVSGEPLAFRMHAAGPADGIVFRPLYQVHHQRYAAYWHFVKKANDQDRAR